MGIGSLSSWCCVVLEGGSLFSRTKKTLGFEKKQKVSDKRWSVHIQFVYSFARNLVVDYPIYSKSWKFIYGDTSFNVGALVKLADFEIGEVPKLRELVEVGVGEDELQRLELGNNVQAGEVEATRYFKADCFQPLHRGCGEISQYAS